MKINLFLFSGIFLCILSLNVLAQEDIKDRFAEKREEINQIKKEYIGQRINLDTTQENAFWEKYDIYIEKKMRLKQQMARTRRQNDNLTISDQELNENIEKLFVLNQEELDLEKQSKSELLKIINIRQLAELYRSEKEFIRKLLHTLRGRGAHMENGNNRKEEE